MRKYTFPMVILLILVIAVIAAMFSGCQNLSFIPGASYGYYIWEDDGSIHICWSIDRKDASFSGTVSTDGKIDDVELLDWEEGDISEVSGNTLSYRSTLGTEDYMDGIALEVTGYTYIELDPRINDGYDLSRVHIGAFLNNPEDSPFRIGPDYFQEVRDIPWYERHPFSGFFEKLLKNKYFTFAFLFIIGVVIIEIIRITAFSDRRFRKLYTGLAYIGLVCLGIIIYLLLRFFVL